MGRVCFLMGMFLLKSIPTVVYRRVRNAGAPVHQGDFCQKWRLQDFPDGPEDGDFGFCVENEKN